MRRSIERNQRFALAAAVLFALAAGYELWHVVSVQRLGGTLALPITMIAAIVQLVVWASAAVLLVVRDRVGARLLRASFGLSAVGAFLVLAHGLVLAMLGEPENAAFILGGLVLAVLVKLAWTPFPWTYGDEPSAAPPHQIVRGPEGEEHEVF